MDKEPDHVVRISDEAKFIRNDEGLYYREGQKETMPTTYYQYPLSRLMETGDFRYPEESHPVQTRSGRGYIPSNITLRVYEVYKHCHGEQQKLITGDCRGGFGVNEVIAYLYAYPFPKNDWSRIVNAALKGMKDI